MFLGTCVCVFECIQLLAIVCIGRCSMYVCVCMSVCVSAPNPVIKLYIKMHTHVSYKLCTVGLYCVCKLRLCVCCVMQEMAHAWEEYNMLEKSVEQLRTALQAHMNHSATPQVRTGTAAQSRLTSKLPALVFQLKCPAFLLAGSFMQYLQLLNSLSFQIM